MNGFLLDTERGMADDVRLHRCGRLKRVIYEWNAAKAKANLQKHGISFDEGATVFLDPGALTFPDPYHSGGEEREITIGYTAANQVVFVSHCQRGNRVRIISVRRATRRERSQYEEGIGKEIG